MIFMGGVKNIIFKVFRVFKVFKVFKVFRVLKLYVFILTEENIQKLVQ